MPFDWMPSFRKTLGWRALPCRDPLGLDTISPNQRQKVKLSLNCSNIGRSRLPNRVIITGPCPGLVCPYVAPISHVLPSILHYYLLANGYTPMP